MANITILYSAVDGWTSRRGFKTIEGARKFAHKMVGLNPEIGHGYAVSGDGVGKVTVRGASLADLCPAVADSEPQALPTLCDTAYCDPREGLVTSGPHAGLVTKEERDEEFERYLDGDNAPDPDAAYERHLETR